jgi:hypothetical protein
MNKNQLISLAKVGVPILLSYFIFLAVFSHTYSTPVKNTPPPAVSSSVSDTLSGTKYSEGGINNYRETNPHGSYFIGFDELTQNGVSYNDSLYIQDVLTNFTMYNLKTFNGKISYVAKSFTDKGSVPNETMVYSFQFGVNDTNIHTVSVNSTTVGSVSGDGTIQISISDSQGAELFNKTFTVDSPD